ncbi:MAG: response regulator [Acidobacteriota bacterium]
MAHELRKRRDLAYIAAVVSGIFAHAVLITYPWEGSTELHTLMEVIATLLALMVGVVALVRFYSEKNDMFLLLGTGFLGTALLDGYHAIVTSQWFDQLWPSAPPSLIPWSWNASRTFLSFLMLLSWWAWKREERLKEKGLIREKVVYAVVSALTLSSFVFFAFVPLPRAYYPEFTFGRPEEFLSAAFFLLALIGYLKKGAWKEDVFEHWLILSLIVGLIGQTLFMSRSLQLFDTMFDAAHLLKDLSYACVLTGLLGSVHQMARALTASQERIHAIVDTAVEGIITIDERGFIDSFNRGAEHIFGYPSEEVLEQNVKMLMPAPDHEQHEEYINQYLRTGHRKIIGIGREVMGRRKDGSTFPMDLAISEIKLGNQRIFTGIIRDISERKEAERNLTQAKEQADAANITKSKFLANMSHELRTPLNSVIGFTNILLKDTNKPLGEQGTDYLNRIVNNGKHLLELINSILDLSKVEAGQLQLSIRQTSIEQLVSDVVTPFEAELVGRDVKLLVEMPPGIPSIQTDPGKLKQILLNLVNNALKFTEQGSVTLRIQSDLERRFPTRIEVIDTGIGIPQMQLETIFEAFQQVETGTSRKYQGTGLGLNISQSLCRLMGYQLEVRSELGQGSTFSIVLQPEVVSSSSSGLGQSVRTPFPKPSPDLSKVDSPGRLPPIRVLLIDDDSSARLILKHQIEDLGYQVLTASSGQEGLRMAQEFQPDLITLDLLMPAMGGWEVLRELKNNDQTQRIPVVIVSVVAEEARGVHWGMVDLLNKPVAKEELFQVLRRYLESGKRRVLVVDDSEDSRDLIREHLESQEMDIESASNGEEALALMERFHPDLIILDLLMPVMDGLTFLRTLRKNPQFSHLPVVVVTAKNLTDEEVQAISQQVSAVLKKGDTLNQELQSVLKQVLGLDP